jgi:hypothetical protein
MTNTDAQPGNESSGKKRGAQPGNRNARTHGFYSKDLAADQQEVLKAAAGLSNFDQEVAFLRLRIHSIITKDPDNHAVLLKALSMLIKLIEANDEYILRHRKGGFFDPELNSDTDRGAFEGSGEFGGSSQ